MNQYQILSQDCQTQTLQNSNEKQNLLHNNVDTLEK